MNLILLSQGSALKIYTGLLPHLREELEIDQLGIFVADQLFFESWTASHSELLNSDIAYLKEWEILRDAPREVIDPNVLDQYDWAPLIADRRLTLGANVKYTQDYAPRYTRNQMLQITQLTIKRINTFLDDVQPHAILGFNMVTAAEYLFYPIAKERGIDYRQLKNAKIANYVMLNRDPLIISTELKDHEATLQPSIVRHHVAQKYLQLAQTKQSTYEGHVILKPPALSSALSPQLLPKLARAAAFEAVKPFKFPGDHQSGGIKPVWYFNVVKPLRTWRQHRYLSKHYLDPKQLPKFSGSNKEKTTQSPSFLPATSYKLQASNYVFFPLHTEPEISLSVYARYLQNQIEVIRNIAQSLPLTWTLIIKDHPRSLGIRTTRYYQKLLEIPNVRLVNPYLPSYDIIEHATAVAVITSWVGFEAVISQKPVITLGECSFNALPNTMVAKNTAPQHFRRDLDQLLANYQYDEAALLQHIEAVLSVSHPVNLYSEVLAKPNRHQTPQSAQQKAQVFQSFAHFIAGRIKQQQPAKTQQAATPIKKHALSHV